ncbi:MAG: type II 3-dehydroquinate dehydratase [Pseudohongiellaceae bacterium]
MASMLIINGPNLNLLGSREPEVYGSDTLNDIIGRMHKLATEAGHELQHLQSNAEHELINRIQAAKNDGTVFIIINPAAFTHTSIALRDTLLAVELPFIEVHLSNLYRREPYRRHSYLSDIAVGTIVGLGAHGYELALQAAIRKLSG